MVARREMKIPSRDRIRSFLVRAKMAAALALTKKTKKPKKQIKTRKAIKLQKIFLRTRPLTAALTRNTRKPAA